MVTRVLKTRGAPNSTTFGNVGDMRIDIDTNNVYRCARVITEGENHGFITVYCNERHNAIYEWEIVSLEEVDTYILVDEDGNEFPAVLVGDEVVFTATANDIREGTVAATADGVTVGTKEIPAYHTTEGVELVPGGKSFAIKIAEDNRYDYTKLQAILCPVNGTIAESVAADKVCINDNVYLVGTSESLAKISLDHADKSINLGITNDTGKPFVIRYFTYKEEY